MFLPYSPFYTQPHYWYDYYYYYYNRMNELEDEIDEKDEEYRDCKDEKKKFKKKMKMMPPVFCPLQAAAGMPMYGQPMMCPAMQPIMCPMMQQSQMWPMMGMGHQGYSMMDGEE